MHHFRLPFLNEIISTTIHIISHQNENCKRKMRKSQFSEMCTILMEVFCVFWENYDYLCRKIGKSANAVAAECGVKSTGTVSAWKKGALPNAKTLSAIAKYLGVSVEDLTGDFIPAKKEPAASGLVNGDAELTAYLEELKTRPEMRMLFHTFAGATKDQIEAIVKAWEAMQGK